MDLFSATEALTSIPLADGELYFLAQLPGAQEERLARLIAETAWRADSITLWGKRYLQPRLTAWYGTARYRYSGLSLEPLPWTPLLLELKQAVEQACGRSFNSVLLNYYRDQHDSMGFHSDDERELGPEPAIASLSLGAARQFVLRHKASRQSIKVLLGDGSLIVMAGALQSHWQHAIHKQRQPCGPRVNLTFRSII